MENTTTKQTTNSKISTRVMVCTAMLAAVSFLLSFLEVPMLLSPSFARMDLSCLLYTSRCV